MKPVVNSTGKPSEQKRYLILQYMFTRERAIRIPPTIREIGNNTGITSTSVVSWYLGTLAKMDLIEIEGKISRSARLTKSGRALVIKSLGIKADALCPHCGEILDAKYLTLLKGIREAERVKI